MRQASSYLSYHSNPVQRNSLSPVYENYASVPAADERAVVTSLYSEAYTTGVLTLGQSLKDVNTTARRILLYLPHRITPRSLCRLQANGWELQPVERIPPPDAGRGVYHRFLDQYTKLHVWGLDKAGIKAVVYIDGDTLVRANFDELWQLPFNLAAVGDIYGDKRGFTLSFNAGVMFLRTSSAVRDDMLSKIGTANYKHDDAEQGFLNLYFGTQVARLPYIYNANLAIKRKDSAIWASMMPHARIVHYTLVKPFLDDDEAASVDPRDYDVETRLGLERKKAMTGGLWRDEMAWWESAWQDMNAELEGKCS